MNARSRLAVVAAGTLVGVVVGLGTTPGAAAVTGEEVGTVLETQLSTAHVPGGGYALVTPGGVDADGVGTAGKEKATSTTPYVIGSTTKSMTALAVLQLVDSGDVDLDAPVRTYVPELTLADGEPVEAITVRHLLQHTSGLDDLRGGPLLASATDGTPLQAVAEVKGAELASAPGETWRYANLNYVLAGLVVERASGASYPEYLEEHVFDPLGMDDSTAQALPTESTPGQRFWFGIGTESGPVVREAMVAAGYVVSTATDLGRYLAMYLAGGVSADGTRVLSRSGLRTMLAPGPDAQLGPWADAMASRYAMGWFVGGPWGPDTIFHPGNSPDTSTMLAFSPERGVGIAAVVSAGHELPGSPALTDQMTSNVVAAALDEPVGEAPSLFGFYLVFDLVALALVGLAAAGVVRALAALRRGREPSRRRLAVVGVVVRLVGAAALALVPLLLGSWAALWTWAPDLGVVFVAVTVLLASAGLLRAAVLLRRARPLTVSGPDGVLRPWRTTRRS